MMKLAMAKRSFSHEEILNIIIQSNNINEKCEKAIITALI